MPDEIDVMVETRRPRRRGILWLTLGWAFLALGAAGAVPPVLPTTPFVLLAAPAPLAGQSPPVGPAIRDWETYGAIVRPNKIVACSVMALIFLISLIAGFAWWILVIQAACMIPAALYVVTGPDGRRG